MTGGEGGGGASYAGRCWDVRTENARLVRSQVEAVKLSEQS